MEPTAFNRLIWSVGASRILSHQLVLSALTAVNGSFGWYRRLVPQEVITASLRSDFRRRVGRPKRAPGIEAGPENLIERRRRDPIHGRFRPRKSPFARSSAPTSPEAPHTVLCRGHGRAKRRKSTILATNNSAVHHGCCSALNSVDRPLFPRRSGTELAANQSDGRCSLYVFRCSNLPTRSQPAGRRACRSAFL